MAFRSAASASFAVAAGTAPTPAGAVAGDTVIMIISEDSSGTSISGTPPAGWTLVANSQTTTDGELNYVYERLLTGTDSFAWTGFTGAWVVVTTAFTGRKTSNVVTFVTKSDAGNVTNTSPYNATANGGSAEAGDDYLMIVWVDQIAQTSVFSYAAPAGTANSVNYSPGNWGSIGVFTIDGIVAGATGAKTTTITRTGGPANDSGWAAMVMTLRSSSAGGSKPIRMQANGQYFANLFVQSSGGAVTGGRMKQYSNGTVQLLNMVESIGLHKLYANGTFVCNSFSEI